MREKITLEKFLDLKSKIMAEINYAEEHGEEIENVAGFVDELINKILSLQEELFSYDLSEVPFESWENLTLITDEDHKLDFTGTNANIDFSIFENPGNTDYHSCKIRHLEAVPSIARPDSFDEEVVKQYPNIFLSDSFSADFKEKYYNKELTLEDLTGLTDEQYDELKEKRIKWHMSDRNSLNASLSLKKIVEIYNYSKELYDMVLYIDDRRYYTSPDFSSTKYPSLMEKVEKAELSDIKDLYYNFLAEHLLQPQEDLSSPIYPVIFKRENANLFINDVDLPMDVRRRYATKKLTIMDLVNYPDVFKTLPIDTFVDRMNPLLSHFNQSYSVRDYINLIFKYPDVFKWISENRSEFDTIGSSYIPRVLEKLMVSGADAETTFLDGIKDFLAERIIVKEETRMGEDGTPEYVTVFDFPNWADSLHLKGIERIKTREELLSLDEHTLIYDKAQREVIKELGLENVKRIEQEFEIFSRQKSDMYRELPLLDILDRMMVNNNYSGIGHGRYTIVDFHKGSLNYPEFLRTFLQLMSNLQISNEIWNEYIKFKDELKQKYPGLVLAEDAPQALKEDFYSTNLTPKAFYNRPEYIPYLVDKDLLGVLDFAIPLITREGVDLKNNKFEPDRSDFIEEYQKRYGNEKTLQLLCRYGELLDEITIKALNNEIENEQEIEKCIIDAIYNYILKNKRDAKYEYLKSCPEFVSAHPELFLDEDKLVGFTDEQRQDIHNKFYKRSMKFEDIRVHPELREIIRDKDFTFIFGEHSDDIKNVSIFGNEKALDLMEKYGAYLNNLFTILEGYKVRGRVDQYKKPDDTPFTFEDYEELIKRSIFKSCYEGSKRYYPDTAPEFLKETHPELFLDEGAPQELIEFFYSDQERTDSPFIDLQTHTDWLPYLANKSIKTAVLRRAYYKETYMMYFEKLGDEVAIALGIKYAGAIDMMLKNDKLNDLFAWNQKTGGRFLPDYAIMSNIPLEEADNFLAHGDNWRRVMKNREFTRDLESKDALAKISCIFGAFNGDSRGLKQADDLLSSLPRTISKNYAHLIGQIDDDIESITRRSEFFHEGMSEEEIKEAKTKWMTSLSNSNNQEIADLLLVLIADANEDKFPIDYTKPLMEQFYRPRDISEERKKRGEQPDGSRVLTFNPDRYSNVTTAIRNILGTRSSLPILTADKAHKLFGPAKAQYDPAFREFFMKNEERILTDPELIKYLGRIQRSFDKIRTVNSNRVLTLDLAIQFVKTNAFDNIEVGNDKVATVARIADFTQEEFEVLQQIYNVGKQRVFSSIPRVQDTSKDKYGQSYSYEMLSLDDPLALGIGELSDCCQRINDCAEMCVEHSMIDKNGRVFVIRDQEGNIVAQSWVWRNGDVLCFDNIEIPDNAFERAKRSKNPLTTEELSDLVFGIYQKAAGQLIEQDKVVYEELLHNGQITQEQYDGLRLGKVTVGLGYNDIKNSILRNSAPDKGHIARPLPFTPAVPLSRSLYTNDSKEQHILVEREGRTDYSGPTLALHSDKPTELTDATIEESDVRLFNSLATSSDDDYEVLDDESQTPLEDIASSINLHSNNVRAVMHPNYGIIYESDEEKVKIGELVFNTLVIEKGIEKDITPTVLNQLKLALDQILQGKRLDMSQLDNKAKEMIERALAINEELDEERGVSHAR